MFRNVNGLIRRDGGARQGNPARTLPRGGCGGKAERWTIVPEKLSRAGQNGAEFYGQNAWREAARPYQRMRVISISGVREDAR